MDILIDDLTNQTGFMLQRPGPGEQIEISNIDFSPTLSEQFYTDEASYANTLPNREATRDQTDWRKGVGELKFKSLDSLGKRYGKSVGCDARFLDRVVLGPIVNAVSAPAFGTETIDLSNKDFEKWTGSAADNWTDVGSPTVVEETTTVHGGSSAWKQTDNTANVGTEQYAAHSPAVENVSTTVSVWVRAETNPLPVKLDIIERGVSLGSQTGTAATGSWTQITKAVTPTSGESSCLLCRITRTDTTNGNLIVDDFAISATESTPSTLGTVTSSALYNSKFYIGSNNGLFEWDDGNDQYNFIEGSPRYITDIEPFTEGTTDYIFIACGVDKGYWYWDGTTLTVAGACTATDTGTAGNVDVGAHSWKVTFVTANGETTLGTVSNVVTIASSAKQVSLTYVPLGGGGTTARNIYRTVAGDTGDYKYVGQIANNTGTSFTDNVADASLGSVGPASNTTGNTFSKAQQASPDHNAQYFADADGTLWKNETTTAIASNNAPVAGSWSTPVTVGVTSKVINALLAHKGNLYVSKENAWYDENSGSPAELIDELDTQDDSNSGVSPISWKAKAYAPFGLQALYEYDSGNATYQTISLADFAPGQLELSGQVLGMAADSSYLYAFLKGDSTSGNEGTGIQIVAGRYETVGDTSAWAWHPIQEKTGTAVKFVQISPNESPNKLWFCLTVSGTDTMYYVKLPDKYADVANSTSYTFLTGGKLITGYFDLNFPAEDKAWASVTMHTKSLTANITVAVAYQLDNDTSWTTWNTFNTSPIQTKYFSSSSVIKGKRIRFRLTFATNDTSKTPELIAFVVRGHVAWPRRKDFVLPILIEEGQTDRNGVKLEGTALTREGRLRLAATKEWVKLLMREANSSGVETEVTYIVRFQSMREVWLKMEKGRATKKLFTLVASEVKLA